MNESKLQDLQIDFSIEYLIALVQKEVDEHPEIIHIPVSKNFTEEE